MDKRYLGALILSPLIVVLFLGGIYLKFLVMILSLFGMYEFFSIAKKDNIRPLSIIAYILCIIYYIFFIDNNINYSMIFSAVIISIFMMLCIPVINEKYNFIDISITILGYIYISIFFSFIVLINGKDYGEYLVWLVFISSWMCDTMAYYVGKYFGKNKLCPKVSPKKTIEGSIGGLIGSTLSCGIYGVILNKIGVNIPIFNFFLIGLFSGLFCQFGDLAASSIKRYVNVKDYSNLIPGHGGILDRFDSILFSSVIVYYYISIVIGI
ncbi:phosphatidate cytidylyltransferase [Clostridium sp.]|jgi:phosphatidate cytidylyltransferase|uniref:phosphatidate cytidylyltransferase n=1 Tax=Clostridium sp. TaxID=1506 RepID=UPI0039F54CB9